MSVVELDRIAGHLGSVIDGFDPSVCDGPLARRYVLAFAKIERLAANAKVLAVGRVDGLSAAPADAGTTAEWLAGQTGTTRGDAERATKTAHDVKPGSKTEAAMRAGTISPTQAAEIAATTKTDPSAETAMLGLAASNAGIGKLRAEGQRRRAAAEDATERAARMRARVGMRRFTDEHDMVNFLFTMLPEQAAEFAPIFEAFARREFDRATRDGRRETIGWYAIEALLAMAHEAVAHAKADRGGAHPMPPAAVPDDGRGGPADETRPDGKRDPDVRGDDVPGDHAPGARHPGERTPSQPDPGDDDARGDRGASDAPTGKPSSLPAPARPPKPPDGVKLRDVHALLLIDLPILLRGHQLPGERCEIAGIGPVNVEYARSLLGPATIDLLVKDGADVRTIAHAGRSPNRKQKAALLAQWECEVRGCPRSRHLEVDHIVPYATSGETRTTDLGPKCTYHHDLKTYRGWTDGPRGPDGKRELHPPGRPRANAPPAASSA